MRLAYLVQGHKHPEQIARLARRLQSADSQVWWHVSAAKRGLDDAVRPRVAGLPYVHEVPARKMYWNSWTFVDAILASMRQALASGYDFDYAVLMTAQDYPLLGHAPMLDYFERLEGRSLLDHFPLPAEGWANENGGLDRFYLHHHVIPTPWDRLGEIRFQTKPLRKRKLPDGFELWGGSGYWALSRRHIEQVMRVLDEYPDFESLFHLAAVPDELFFHTILLSTVPEEEFVNQGSSYVVWRDAPTPHPAVLTSEDFDDIASSGFPFARKFDISVDARILDLLDQHAGEPTGPSAPETA